MVAIKKIVPIVVGWLQLVPKHTLRACSIYLTTTNNRSTEDRGNCSNIADNPIHDALPDKLIGTQAVVETRLAKYVAVSLLTRDLLDTTAVRHVFCCCIKYCILCNVCMIYIMCACLIPATDGRKNEL